jgi:2-polyprenyl-3-methyl-5-hydroxy-6-metoxy-1,4-benzoquinol methylase
MSGPEIHSPHEDVTGKETLDLFAEALHFNQWLFSSVSPFCKGNILEIGSGIGSISKLLLEKYNNVNLSDLRVQYCDILEKKFVGHPHLCKIFQLDLGVPDLHQTHPMLISQFDSIIASNVVEHVEDDRLAIRNCYDMLKPKGRLIVLVPAYNALYNSLDKDLGHFRRYNKSGLSGLFSGQGFSIMHSQYFNAAGIPGWWFSGSILKKTMLPKHQLGLFNKLVIIFRLFDKIIFNQIGLSLIVVGEKN